MGSELWTSPMTGYRRRGTRLAELRKHFEEGITAAAILEPLRSCPADADAFEMLDVLQERDFDVAGVQESELSPVHGYVEQHDLSKGGRVREHVCELTPAVLIADSTPLAEIFDVLAKQSFTFVLVGPQVRGVITQADLNKPPVRIYLFGLLSLVEMHVTFWIRSEFPDGGWEQSLNGKGLRTAKRLQKRKQERGHHTGLLDCLTLGDKKRILSSASRVRDRLGLKDSELGTFDEIQALRNRLAHASEDLVEGGTWGAIAEIVTLSEAIVGRSDETIEAEAATQAGDYRDSLWAST